MPKVGTTYKLDLLVALYMFCIAVAELMGGKTFTLLTIGDFRLSSSVALFVVPIIFSINDIVAEVHGRERARSIVRSGLLVVALILIFALVATRIPPSPRFAPREAAYDAVFGVSARIAAASLIAFMSAEFLDVYIFSKLRQRLKEKALWLRNNLSNFIAQFVDTTVFITLAFYTFGDPFSQNLSFLIGLILPYWLLKTGMSVIETPFVYAGVKWLRKEN